MAEFLAEALL